MIACVHAGCRLARQRAGDPRVCLSRDIMYGGMIHICNVDRATVWLRPARIGPTAKPIGGREQSFWVISLAGMANRHVCKDIVRTHPPCSVRCGQCIRCADMLTTSRVAPMLSVGSYCSTHTASCPQHGHAPLSIQCTASAGIHLLLSWTVWRLLAASFW